MESFPADYRHPFVDETLDSGVVPTGTHLRAESTILVRKRPVT